MKNEYFALKEDQKKAFSLHVKKKKKPVSPQIWVQIDITK